MLIQAATRDGLVQMLREAPWIIRNGVGAVNPTRELLESTQRRGLLAIARLWGGGPATRRLMPCRGLRRPMLAAQSSLVVRFGAQCATTVPGR
jgi:hypothetical protein